MAELPYTLGEELWEKPDVILQQAPVLQFRDGYLEPAVQADLLQYHPEVVLYHPKIPQNTGTISRLCAGLSATLHLIEPMAFQITDKALKRAGLDYWSYVRVFVHKNFDHFRQARPNRRLVFVETGGACSPYEFAFLPGDVLVFGAETYGIPKDLIQAECAANTAALVTIPMYNRGVRSLNVANTVSIVLSLAISQLHSVPKNSRFPHG